MAKLNQILAIEKGLKAKRHNDLTLSYQNLQNSALLSGISRTYRPKAEDGEQFPPESTKVQMKAKDAILGTKQVLSKIFDVTALKDYTNCQATADVVVGERTLLKGAPVSYLLWLEKELTDLHTFVKKLPVLDSSESWEYDKAQDCYATPVTQTVKSKKIPRNHVKAEATDKHPAQVEVYHEDVVVGTWNTVKYSGALPQKDVTEMLERVETLQEAVKYARERANSIDTVPQPQAASLLSYIFG